MSDLQWRMGAILACAALGAECVSGCSAILGDFDVQSGGGESSDASADAPPEGGAADVSAGDAPNVDAQGVTCTAAENVCLDENTLQSCKATGHGFDTSSCAAGCSATAGAHCKRLYPSPPVTLADLSVVNVASVSLPAGETILNTDTGAISGMLTRAANVITTKSEVIGGIAFHQSGGAGIFTFGSLTVAAGATLKVVGANVVALVSEENLLVYGVIDARPMDPSGALCPAGPSAGPGGRPGGAGGMPGPTPVNGTAGSGPGGGGGGVRPLQGNAAGGGGAGHVAAGGSGSGGCHQGVVSTGGGVGGVLYDTGLVGGSGGGGGGGASGGGGGGALALVAAGVITVGNSSAIGGVNAGGCGGLGALGGGGGGSGGAVVLEAPVVQIASLGTVAANGGGGGGSLASTATPGQAGQLSASPSLGAGSSSFGAEGGNGGAGDSPVGGAAINAVCGSLEGLGGGGAAGRILINAVGAAPTVHPHAVLSPTKASGAAKFGAADVH